MIKKHSLEGTDLTKEDLERLLDAFALSFQPLGKSKNPLDQESYIQATTLLEELANRYGICLLRERNNYDSQNQSAEMMDSVALLDSLNSFQRDFGIGIQPGEDFDAQYALGLIMVDLFERYKVAEIAYERIGGKNRPVGVKRWYMRNATKTLDELISERMS